MDLVYSAMFSYMCGEGCAVMKKLFYRFFWDIVAIALGGVIAFIMYTIMFGG